jgi:signal transduction histidine kinase
MASSAQLLAIVNDILDLTSIDAGVMGLDLAEINAADVVEEALRTVGERLAEARLRLVTDVPANVGAFVADDKRVHQILVNLLSNAIAYSHEGGTVRLAAHRVGGFIEFEVADDGAGIPTGFINSVFDRFSSLPRGASRGGVGLGLSIVKAFVALHGGTVEIASEEGRGTTVTVRLPLRPALDAAAAE